MRLDAKQHLATTANRHPINNNVEELQISLETFIKRAITQKPYPRKDLRATSERTVDTLQPNIKRHYRRKRRDVSRLRLVSRVFFPGKRLEGRAFHPRRGVHNAFKRGETRVQPARTRVYRGATMQRASGGPRDGGLASRTCIYGRKNILS